MTLNKRQQNHLDAMGLVRWVSRDTPEESAAEPAIHQPDSARTAVESSVGKEVTTAIPASEMDWESLTASIRSCTACDLHTHRHHAVVGAGNQGADWMIIGEAPGEQEDLQGEPFVGRAGLLLNNILSAVGLSRDTVYIANVIKCRPPGNRDPHAEEISACLPYLERQIQLINPRIILIVGRVAAQTLLDTDSPVGRMRGRVHYYGAQKVPVVVTYHPAYLLRRPTEKTKTWDDLKLALGVLNDSPLQ